jgi:hypothetical protein
MAVNVVENMMYRTSFSSLVFRINFMKAAFGKYLYTHNRRYKDKMGPNGNYSPLIKHSLSYYIHFKP